MEKNKKFPSAEGIKSMQATLSTKMYSRFKWLLSAADTSSPILDPALESNFEQAFLVPPAWSNWTQTRSRMSEDDFKKTISDWTLNYKPGKQQDLRGHLRVYMRESDLPATNLEIDAYCMAASWVNKQIVVKIVPLEPLEAGKKIEAPKKSTKGADRTDDKEISSKTSEKESSSKSSEKESGKDNNETAKEDEGVVSEDSPPPKPKQPKSRSTIKIGQKANHKPLAWTIDSHSVWTKSGHNRPPLFSTATFMAIDPEDADKYLSQDNMFAMAKFYAEAGLIEDVDTFWTGKQTIQAKYMHVRELEQARTRKNLTADGTDPGEDKFKESYQDLSWLENYGKSAKFDCY